MNDIHSLIPSGYKWRYFWDMRNAVGSSVPSSIPGKPMLTMQNQAAKRLTTAGILMTGAATSNCVIPAHADNNNKTACHITIRFKPGITFAAGASADQYLFNKAADANNYLRIRFEADDGKLYWEQGDGVGGNQFQLTSTTASWTVDTWYTVTASLTGGPVQRLLVNGALEDSDTQAALNTPNGGDMILGSSSDGGADGFTGTIDYFCMGNGATATVALTSAEEVNFYHGVPPATAKVQYLLLLDEGRGSTANNRGSGTGNGTLDSAVTWSFLSRPNSCLSLDGINDYASSQAALDISGPITVVHIEQARETLSTSISGSRKKVRLGTGTQYLHLYYNASAGLRFLQKGSGSSTADITVTNTFTIGTFVTYVVTIGTSAALYANNSLLGSDATMGTISQAYPQVLFLGSEAGTDHFDTSRYIAVGIISGALTQDEVYELTRRIKSYYGV